MSILIFLAGLAIGAIFSGVIFKLYSRGKNAAKGLSKDINEEWKNKRSQL